MSAMKEALMFAEENRAFFVWAHENYQDHPVGPLILALHIYEGCRVHSDSIFWPMMSLFSGVEKHWTPQVWLNVATLVLQLGKELKGL